MDGWGLRTYTSDRAMEAYVEMDTDVAAVESSHADQVYNIRILTVRFQSPRLTGVSHKRDTRAFVSFFFRARLDD